LDRRSSVRVAGGRYETRVVATRRREPVGDAGRL